MCIYYYYYARDIYSFKNLFLVWKGSSRFPWVFWVCVHFTFYSFSGKKDSKYSETVFVPFSTTTSPSLFYNSPKKKRKKMNSSKRDKEIEETCMGLLLSLRIFPCAKKGSGGIISLYLMAYKSGASRHKMLQPHQKNCMLYSNSKEVEGKNKLRSTKESRDTWNRHQYHFCITYVYFFLFFFLFLYKKEEKDAHLTPTNELLSTRICSTILQKKNFL